MQSTGIIRITWSLKMTGHENLIDLYARKNILAFAVGLLIIPAYLLIGVTPAKEAMNWLLWVHIIIGNLKKFLNGTYHGVSSHYLQEYLDEFCYRFNRRFWEFELPYRLLNACLTHVPVKLPVNC